MSANDLNPSWLNPRGASSGAAEDPQGSQPSWCRPAAASSSQPSWLNPVAAPPAQTAPSAPRKNWFSFGRSEPPAEITSVVVDGDVGHAPPAPKPTRSSRERGPEGDKFCKEYRCQILLGCLAVAILADGIAMWRLKAGDYKTFGVCFGLAFAANMLMMLVFFGPIKYCAGALSRKRMITTLFFYGLTALVIFLCFAETEPMVILLLFLCQQVAWAANIAAGFGCTPCALPESDSRAADYQRNQQ